MIWGIGSGRDGRGGFGDGDWKGRLLLYGVGCGDLRGRKKVWVGWGCVGGG